MAHVTENLDFSGLFKLDVLLHLDISTYSFYEVGLKKYLAFSSDKELIFIYINAQSERFEKNYDWDFLDNPISCMCFEPSGTWVLILSDQKVLLVPFLPLFIPQNTFDHKWSLSSVTVLPIAQIAKATSVVWWLTKESENILIIGSKVRLFLI
jgi:WD40 repeat protein